MRIIELEQVTSTNEYLKTLKTDEDVAVVAKIQTDGRGTKGRSFCSENGGLYISVLKNYKDFSVTDAFKIMINSCVAVCRTLESLSLSPVIRWPNDVLVCGKKICGTLIENTFCGGRITRSVVGIGINIFNELPDELKPIATSVYIQTGKKLTVSSIASLLLKNLENNYGIDEYKKYINWLGCTVLIKTLNGGFTAVAKDVSDDGRLVAEQNGKQVYLSAAEVSLRL